MMEDALKEALDTRTFEPLGYTGGGCISKGAAYQTDHGVLFIKDNSGKDARLMFDGEFASLQALHRAGVVRVPKPIKVIDRPGVGALFAAEYIEMKSLSKHSAKLGEQLARLHLHNEELGKRIQREASSVHRDPELKFIDRFGFDVKTCCGYIAQDNTWQDSWENFFAGKIESQVKMVEENHGDREVRDIWTKVLSRLPALFEGLQVTPALLHGDLWSGNAAETVNEPVMFDPASFYGHGEYDLAISRMFGGFSKKFFDSYFSVIPKCEGYKERSNVYQAFHYLNHWNHFGDGYKTSSLQSLKAVLH